MRKLLITGVPGTGKTTLGEYLAQHHGFFHQDMEKNSFQPIHDFQAAPDDFIAQLQTHGDIVVTWGFGPTTHRALIDLLCVDGFEQFWLDGDRIASFKAFMHREKHDDAMELAYYVQLSNIIKSNIVTELSPRPLNPFNEEGDFRSIMSVAKEVLQHP